MLDARIFYLWRRRRWILLYGAVALVAFLPADPFLWPNLPLRL